MTETIKKLKIEGLYVISISCGSRKFCRLMSSKTDLAIRNYTSRPITRVTDFFKLFNECLSHLNWNGELTIEHGKAIVEMERRIKVNQEDRWIVDNNINAKICTPN